MVSTSTYCRPPSKAATLHRIPGVFSQAATRTFCLDSMALVRARSPEPGGTEASTSLVTSVNLCGTVTRMVLPGSSSSRLRARKPSVMRARPGRHRGFHFLGDVGEFVRHGDAHGLA